MVLAYEVLLKTILQDYAWNELSRLPMSVLLMRNH